MSNGGTIGTTSLESAVRTCKVNTGYANKIESDRFLNPVNMVCPLWNGLDTAGRQACPDSFYTKRGGCNSAEDRVVVENNVSRPQYMEYITLSAGGIEGNIYNQAIQAQMQENYNRFGHTAQMQGSQRQTDVTQGTHQFTGQFGLQTGFDQNIQSSCSSGGAPTAYQQAMAQMDHRNLQGGLAQHESYMKQVAAGN